ncbi:RNA polymerase subunit sigma [uncultured Paenibacillus sp.]|uniref:RNA polymerase subunit sigma n=1 Tax=uncultured Paenibacillus sp. TaxID=227322 RepID=UPI00204E072A|nr:RNA polymerase subunit sigma [uncultured Paenibacillus sp.]DAW22619.1 MAG TPA: ECF sigma factor [Caudoviricetes sp.]
MNDAAGVKALLRDRHRISSARFRGDYAASDILLDLNSAIYNAGLTDAQTEAVAWVSGADLTQQQAAEIMGMTQQAVAKTYDEAAEKLAEWYRTRNMQEFTAEYAEVIA